MLTYNGHTLYAGGSSFSVQGFGSRSFESSQYVFDASSLSLSSSRLDCPGCSRSSLSQLLHSRKPLVCLSLPTNPRRTERCSRTDLVRPLSQVGVFLDLHFINKPELHVQIFSKPSPFDSEGNVVDEKTTERVHRVVDSLRTFTHRLRGAAKVEQ